MLTRAGCQTRQERFRALLADHGLDAAVVSDPRDIYFLTGLLLPIVPALPALLYVATEGGSWLATHLADGDPLVDERVTYEFHELSTMHPDPMRRLERVVAGHLTGVPSPRRLGWQVEALPRLLGETLDGTVRPDEWVPIDDGLARLEKRKEADEVDLLRRAAGCSLAAYDGARAAIAPGVTEVAVLAAGHAAATLQAAEAIFHGGDYRCAAFGGPARDRAIAAGELYIIDAWSIYQGYWADLCRTFAVADPTPLQQEVFDHIAAILAEVPTRLEPGARGTDLWRWIDHRLREHPHLRDVGYIHHGGHGVGLRAHEAPDINRDREGIFEVGDVVSCEPGAYTSELNAGIRLENTFHITETGVELLSDYPVALA